MRTNQPPTNLTAAAEVGKLDQPELCKFSQKQLLLKKVIKMCGITSVVGQNFSEPKMLEALAAIEHRGPDDMAAYVDPDESVTLGFTRLSIIDHNTGMQPLQSQCGNISVICNGELYDFERIRSELTQQGHQFSTKGDVEIIIYLYQQYGMDFLSHLRGEFAFILLDKSQKKVIAVRDRFGINPLYYSQLATGGFVFSSEAKGIFATGLVEPEIDPVAVRNMMSIVFVDTIFKNIKAIPPASHMCIDLNDGSHKIAAYWQLDLPPDDQCEDKTIEEWKQVVRDQLDQAVHHRLRADVPVGVYLSGGIDSAAIAGTVARCRPKEALKVFNVSFPEDKDFDEHDRAQKMAASIGADFHSVKCDRRSLLDNFAAALWHSELPAPNLHGVARYMLAKETKKHVSVVLTGEGADENFLGYEYFKGQSVSLSTQIEGTKASSDNVNLGPEAENMVQQLGFVPQFEYTKTFTTKNQKRLNGLLHPDHQQALNKTHPIDQVALRFDRKTTDPHEFKRQRQIYSIKGILATYIIPILGDRPESAHSVEGRQPLLDHKLFEACRKMPNKWKLFKGKEKYVFREAVRDRVTPEMYKIKKWPFAAPPVWVRKGEYQKMDQLIDQHLAPAAIAEAGIFDPKKVKFFQMLLSLIFFDCAFKRKINTALTLMLSIQTIHYLFVKHPKSSYTEFNYKTRSS